MDFYLFIYFFKKREDGLLQPVTSIDVLFILYLTHEVQLLSPFGHFSEFRIIIQERILTSIKLVK